MEFCDSNDGLPSNWIKKESKSHPDKFYYHNTVTKKSVWKLSDLPMQTSKNDKSKVITPNKQFTSISHGSKAIKRNLAEDRLKSFKMGLSKEVAKNIIKDQKILNQNNTTTSESSRSVKKHCTESSLPRHSFSPMPVVKKNLAQQRMKNLSSSFNLESKQLQTTSSRKHKSEMSPNIDIFSPKRLTTRNVNPDTFTPNRSVTIKTSNNGIFTPSRSLTSNNFNDNFTPKSSATKNYDTDNSARKILKSPRKTVQDRLHINNDVCMLDVSEDFTTKETDDKMDWEEIPVHKIVEKVQDVRNNPNICISSNEKLQTSHRNVNHSEDHFYCVIDTNVLLSNLGTIKNMEGTIYHSKSKRNNILYIFLKLMMILFFRYW